MTDAAHGPPGMSWEQVCARRLHRHGLASPTPHARPADVVAAMCGAHAQVMSAAELSIGLRLAGVTRTDIRNALWTEHSLVKTMGPRGTVHLLPIQDLALWTGALSATPPSDTGLPDEARMTPEQTDAVVEAIAIALEDAELTVDELSDAIVERVGPWAGDPVVPAWYGMWPRWRPAIYPAANRGVLCFGPNRGRTVTYTNPHRWLPGLRPTDGDAALAEIARRYLHAYGPATPAHFARWLAVPRRWAAKLFDSVSDDLQQVEAEGFADPGSAKDAADRLHRTRNVPAWVIAGDTDAPPTPARGVRLLPYFDAYTVGSHPRELLFPGRAAGRALSGGQAGNFPVLLVDGTVGGVWHQRRSGRYIDITVEPLDPLTAAQRRDLDEQVERVGEILEGKPRLTVGTVTVGPHA